MALGNTSFTTQHGLNVIGNTEVQQDLKVFGSANVVGDLSVGGSMVFSANVIGNFIPDVSGRALGNTSARWEMYANSLNVSNTSSFNGTVSPTANGVQLGTADNRWFAYTTNINVSNSAVVSNNVSISNNLTVSGGATIGAALSIQSNSVVYANATPGQTVVDTFSASTYRTTKYLVEAKDNTTGYMSTEMLIVHDGSTVYLNEYATINTVATFVTYDADISGGNVRLLATPSSNATIKVARTSII